jgi:hypothetical protein
VKVKALGCQYQVWVVEEKHTELPWLNDVREDGDEQSMVGSAAIPIKAAVVNVDSDVSSGEGDGERVVMGKCRNGQQSGSGVMGDRSTPPLHMIGDKRQEACIQTVLVCAPFKETSTKRDEVGVQVEEVMITTNDKREEFRHVAFNAHYKKIVTLRHLHCDHLAKTVAMC